MTDNSLDNLTAGEVFKLNAQLHKKERQIYAPSFVDRVKELGKKTEQKLRYKSMAIDYVEKWAKSTGFVVLPEAKKEMLVDMYIAGAIEASEELESQIENMKNCDNCVHLKFNRSHQDYECSNLHCFEMSDWELKK